MEKIFFYYISFEYKNHLIDPTIIQTVHRILCQEKGCISFLGIDNSWFVATTKESEELHKILFEATNTPMQVDWSSTFEEDVYRMMSALTMEESSKFPLGKRP